jgi:4-hydroxy-tetrahydrodipicolinate reductase
MSLRVALIGAEGRMGRFAAAQFEDQPDLELVARVGRAGDLGSILEQTRPDVGLDFTSAGRGARHGLVMLEHGVRPVIGTSGVSPAEDAELDGLAKDKGLAGLVVPNFCLGVWLQQELARTAARYLGSIEIIEEHHASKQDAPSGTAADTAAQLAVVRGIEPDEIPVHSVRLQGLFSNQTVLFGGPGEVLRLTHQTFGLEAFAPGILASLRYVARAAPGVRRGIGHAFEGA